MSHDPAPSPAPARIASAAAVDEEIAPDLPALMERMERARKFLYVEREYIKLTLMGVAFVVAGTLFSYERIWRIYLPIVLIATPWVYGWLQMPRIRLANAFRNEVLPFLLRDFGRWNFAHEGPHFSREGFFKAGFLDPTDGVSVSSIITGERFGVPLQLAVISAWRHPVFGIYRGHKATFSGWAANIRLPDLSSGHVLILPGGESPKDPVCKDWVASPLTPSHQLWHAPGQDLPLPSALMARLLPALVQEPNVRFGLSEGALWLLVPGDGERFNLASSFAVALNEPAPYQKARSQLAEMFALIDKLVWPTDQARP